ncbi:hypothetical protein GGF32_007877 [Allomyces javanicus]|nr:hypothetical protein GGF32_007877 [Allomyces javanicus]
MADLLPHESPIPSPPASAHVEVPVPADTDTTSLATTDKDTPHPANAPPCGAGHLLVISHGLFGNNSHTQYLADAFKAAYPDQLDVLNVSCYANDLTLDGVDTCAERLIEELNAYRETNKVTKISFLGYSLGGLIVRFAIGRLHMESFFDTVEPMNFVTMATPHLGVSTPRLRRLADLLVCRSAQQCVMKDRDYDAPLLWVLADPQLPFLQGLARFKRHLIVANTTGDRTVPYLTASIQLESPYTTSPSEPVLPDSPVIIRPVVRDDHEKAIPLPEKSMTREDMARMALFFGLIMPLIFVVWTVMSPWAFYTTKKARTRFATVEDQVLRDIEVLRGQVSRKGLSEDEYVAAMVESLNAALPDMTRIDVDLGEWVHTHAHVVVRNPKMHASGKPVVEYVVSQFRPA